MSPSKQPRVLSGKLPNKEPLWLGPESSDEKRGGITFSLLSRFLTCRERFRLYTIEGLKPTDRFNHRLEYGNMWHLCEEAYAEDSGPEGLGTKRIEQRLREYVQQLLKRYPFSQEEITKWYNVCAVQFPFYLEYWNKHRDIKQKKTNLLAEQVFNVPYQLPSGRIVYLKGKWDSVDLVANKIWLQENKTKGEIDQPSITRQLRYDLQTMIYLISLHHERENPETNWGAGVPIAGVRYNVVRRPLSGGKGTIKQHKPSKSNPRGESEEDYYARLAQYIKDEPEHYFMRWEVEVTDRDIERFKKECLDPILENLCWWYEDRVGIERLVVNDHEQLPTNWRHPYGVRNMIDEGGFGDVDEYMDTGSTVGLTKNTDLFPELSS